MKTKHGSARVESNRFMAIFWMLLFVVGLATSGHALPMGAPVVGEIERMGVDNPADVWSSGWMVVGKDNVIIPRNLLVELPANRLTLQQLFVPTPGNSTSGPPAACLANGESGLAKVDRCNARVLGAYVTIFANRMDSGHVIAGDVRLQKAAESLTGTVTYINHTDGYFRVNGNTNTGAVDDNTGTMVRMNDPGPPSAPGFGRHTIQQGYGCLPGSLNCSADPRFTADEENYTLTFQTGFPVCIPSAANGAGANGAGDPNCPLANRPGSPPLVAPPPIPVPGGLFPFVSPQPPTVGGTVDNSAHFAPILLGDSITAFGNYELIPDNVLGAQFFSAHTLTVSADLATRNDPTQPDYVILREAGWDSPPYPAARARILFVGNATLHGLPLGCGGGGGVCSPDTAVDVYSNHYDQSNTPHRVPLYSTVNDKKGPVAFVQSMGAFQIHPGIDLEFDPARFSKKPDLEPCPILNLAITQLAGEPPTPAGIAADVAAVCSNPQPVDQTAAVLENFKLVAPIAKEVFAITRHKQANPGVQSFDINGNVAPNGQYLSPIPTEWAGYEDIDIGLMKTPYTFSGIPWLLDRRVGPNGCVGACEGTPQPLSPFPFEGFDPRQVALRPGTNTPTVALTMPDPNRIIQFWPFGPGNQLSWNAAALTPGGLPPIQPVQNLAFLVTVLPPPPATGVTLSAAPASPQNAGTQVVFSAAGSGGSGTYEYQFSDNVTGVMAVTRPYGPSPAWIWDTTGLAARNYSVKVDARSAGSVNASEASATAGYTIGTAAATGVTLTASPASPIAGGDNVIFTASVPGGGTYEYEFWGRVAGPIPLSLAQSYGPSNTFKWNTAGIQTGVYEIQVYVRRPGSVAPFEATQTVTYVVTTPTATGVTVAASPASPQLPGTQVTFTANATGGGAYEYQFTGRKVGDATFAPAKTYSNVNTWTWNTTGVAPGQYEIIALARAAGSAVAYETTATIYYTVAQSSITAGLAANPASGTVTAGTPVTFTGTASPAGGNYEYQFLGRQVGQSTFSIAQPYGPSNTWTWGSVAGSWEMQVQVRNAGSSAPFEALQTIPYNVTVPPATGVTLTPSPASPQTAGTSVTFTAAATGGTGTYEYQFLGRQVGSPTFSVAQPYGPGNTWTWGSVTGSWEIQVQARSVGSTAPFDTSATITDIVN